MSKVLTEQRGGVLFVTINRPDVMNACDGETYHALADAWDELERNPALRVGILAGAGSAFCAGTDIKWISTIDVETFNARLYERMKTLTKPVIAAVQGHCNGGGLEQALAADIRVAAEDAQFGFGEVRLGWIPGGYGTQRLPRVVPLGSALEMLYTARRIDATEAHRIGLVNHVVSNDELQQRCEEIASRIVAAAPLAIQAMKQVVSQGVEASLDEGIELEQAAFRRLMKTTDAEEGGRAFAEKRPPRWSGC